MRSPLVLMYHGFCTRRRTDDPENLFVEAAEMERQLRWLLDRGWVALTEQQFLDHRRGRVRAPRRSFLVTIDDALVSVAEHAEPILARLSVPGVLYVPSGLIGKTAAWLPEPADSPILDREALQAISERGTLQLGLHGWDHTNLEGLSPQELHQQVVAARDELIAVVGAPVRTFAYPFGGHDAAARTAVSDAGFEAALSVFDDAGQFAISRVDVNATDTLVNFRIKTTPGYRTLWRLSTRATFLRRAVRRTASWVGRARR